MGDRAKIKGKADALVEWLKGWEGFDDYLKLNALVTKEGDASVNIVVNDAEVEKYIDGTAIRDFTFQIKSVQPWSDGYDQTNVDAVEGLSALLDWLDDQLPDNKPNWEGADITELILLNNAPSLDYVHETDELAEYSITAKLRYKE